MKPKEQSIPWSRVCLVAGSALLASAGLVAIAAVHFWDSWMEEADRMLKSRGDALVGELEQPGAGTAPAVPPQVPSGNLSGEDANFVLIEFARRDGQTSWRDPQWPTGAWTGLREGGGFRTASVDRRTWRVMSLTKDDWNLRLALDVSEIVRERNSGLWTTGTSAVAVAFLAGLGTIAFWNREQRRRQSARQAELRFSANASHEMLTPLATMQARIGLALSNSDATEQDVRLLADLSMEVHNVREIIDAMLLLSQADSGELTLQRTPILLADLLRDLCEATANELADQGIRVEFGCKSSTAVFADERLLRLAFSNLLRNAATYNFPDGFVIVLLNVSDMDKNGAVVSIRNSGPPSPATEAELLFERFHRGTAARHAGTQGHGLGLSLAKAIVEAHSGSIWLEDSNEEHTEFVVRLPVVK